MKEQSLSPAGKNRLHTSRITSRNNRLKGKIALVTGASRGIGLAIAHALAREGANLIISSRHCAELQTAAAALKKNSGRVLVQRCDVRDPQSLEALFAQVKKRFGRLDILINNAGTAQPVLNVEKLSVETWRQVLDTNLTALFLCTRAALPLMKSGGTIVNNLSISAVSVFPGFAAYTASKYGGLGFTNTLREELRERGIRVIALMPGATDTEIWEQFWPEAPRNRMISPESVAEVLLAALLLPANAVVEELKVVPTRGSL